MLKIKNWSLFIRVKHLPINVEKLRLYLLYCVMDIHRIQFKAELDRDKISEIYYLKMKSYIFICNTQIAETST